jgi:hypothetical protein
LRHILKYAGIQYKLKNIHYQETKENRGFYLGGVIPPLDERKAVVMSIQVQSYTYMIPIRDILLSDFSFKQELPKSIQKIREDMTNSNSVSLHIRRGDFIESEEQIKLFGSICIIQYYLNAINYLKNKYSDLRFFIFSNDIAWTETNFAFLENVFFVDTSKENPSDYYDLFLMTQTQHNIIANSTFSWWGAWLNQNPSKIVITPDRWLGNDWLLIDDICPPEWVRISIS